MSLPQSASQTSSGKKSTTDVETLSAMNSFHARRRLGFHGD